ncbi:MAG: DUF5668 domain-containing protein [Flavobacteriales bacterium]|jgi:hypothetical protein|nr:DUF5668 domain-containing protein [Flavobacteriales bacterium]MDG1440828.1 DUF5668 domain-containing protein [Flavobacteriales bacterium]
MMKKGKTIGIVLIVIGVLFLLNNLNLIKVSIVEIIRVYWPVILIWIGVDKLLSKPVKTES